MAARVGVATMSGWRIRWLGLESWRESSVRIQLWRLVYPSNPSLVANRTMEGRLVLARSARFDTVPKARSVGSSRTKAAIRRSVGVSLSLIGAIKSCMDITCTPPANALQSRKPSVRFVTNQI